MAGCPMLQQQGRRCTKLVNLVSSRGKPSGASVGAVVLADFALFIPDGYVSLPGETRNGCLTVFHSRRGVADGPCNNGIVQ